MLSASLGKGMGHSIIKEQDTYRIAQSTHWRVKWAIWRQYVKLWWEGVDSVVSNLLVGARGQRTLKCFGLYELGKVINWSSLLGQKPCSERNLGVGQRNRCNGKRSYNWKGKERIRNRQISRNTKLFSFNHFVNIPETGVWEPWS